MLKELFDVTESGNVYRRLMDINELKAYTNLGGNMARKLGEDSGALIHFGRRALYDRQKIDRYIDGLSQ